MAPFSILPIVTFASLANDLRATDADELGAGTGVAVNNVVREFKTFHVMSI